MVGIGIDVSKAWLDVAVHGSRQVLRFDNDSAGIARLVAWVLEQGPSRVLLEPTGGYEQAVLEAVFAEGLWVCRVNPRQAREFARSTGQLAKTDAIDARVLAEMVQSVHAKLRPWQPEAAWRVELAQWVRRRGQALRLIQQQQQHLASTTHAKLKHLMGATLRALEKEVSLLDQARATHPPTGDAGVAVPQGHRASLSGHRHGAIARAGPIGSPADRQTGGRGAAQ